MREYSKSIKVSANAEDVYAALTNPFALELWTGCPAVMSTEPGTEFELWDGCICGKNLEFRPNELIRQEWYFGEQEEPSIVTIKITARSNVRTEIYVKHINIPDEDYDNIAGGWDEDYLGSLRQFLEEGD